MSKSINSYAAHGPRIDWIEAFFRYNGDFSQGVSLGSVQVPMFKRFLRDAELLNGDKFSDFATTVQAIGLKENRAWELVLVNLAYSPQVGWYIKNVLPNYTYTRDNFIALIEEQGINHDSANVVSIAFKLILKLPFGKGCGLGSVHFKDETERNIVSITRATCHNPDSTVILYALYKFAEACEGYYQFSLDRLMDFDIESKGVSPAQIFGLDEQALSSILSGLSAKYPDFISYSETHGMQTITLRKEKSVKSVLELF
jgi:phosphoadenosine phosphosulfate reductase